MKAALRFALLSLPLAGLVACATTEDRRAASTPQIGQVVPDHQYVSRVENVARTRGIRVAWINPPTVRVEDTALASQD